jgi:hypothetical protein
MVCQKECVNCSTEDDVHYRAELEEFYCDGCYYVNEENAESDYNTERDENQKENDASGWLE